ncbi:hypothetical protein [Sphingomonas sp. NFR15]|uniref:hypothetical protein n=1 Tax=Sphingomonas sp. NFR15 TaxID=1566282 RepID=UPI0015A38590|nr:hypothetical protein [Sphingomonas sp. NFR15]
MVQGRFSNMAIRGSAERSLAGARPHVISACAAMASPMHRDRRKNAPRRSDAFTGFPVHQIRTDATFDRPHAECQETA